MPIRIVALQGSVRPNNNTARALALVAAEMEATYPEVSFDIIDPALMHLPLPGQGTSADVVRLQEALKAADGVILATPEYHGSYSSVMKLLIDNLGFPSPLKNKPIALLGVAAGRIGAIKALEHLRSVASHVGGLVLPGPVSVANVRAVFDEEGNVLDDSIGTMIRGVPASLMNYLQSHVCPFRSLEAVARNTAEG